MRRIKPSHIKNKILKRLIILETLSLCVILIMSYFVIFIPMDKISQLDGASTSKQMAQTLDDFLLEIINNTIEIATSPYLEESAEKYLDDPSVQNYNRLRLCLQNLQSSSIYIRRIVLEPANGELVDSIKNKTMQDTEIINSSWYSNQKKSDYSNGFMWMDRINVANTAYWSAVYHRNFYIWGNKFNILVFFNMNDTLNQIQSLSQNTLNNYAILDGDSQMLYQLNSDYPFNYETSQESAQSNVFGEKYFTNHLESNKWNIVSYMSGETAKDFYINYIIMIVLMFLFMYVVSIIFSLSVLTKSLAPVSKLSGAMREVSKGNLNVRANVETNDEIGELSQIFNQLVCNLNDYIQKTLINEKNEQKMKYNLLISQIDPHFIYNTMNIINSLARLRRYADIIQINTSLIKILQDRLRIRDIEIYDTVGQEIETLKQYLIIMMYRYKYKPNIVYNIDENILDESIPKNIFQPLVENALLHGLQKDNEHNLDSLLKISIYRSDGKIVFEVFDSGEGMSAEKVAQLNNIDTYTAADRGKHIGIANLKNRLMFLYKNNVSIRFESRPGEGTLVRIILPD